MKFELVPAVRKSVPLLISLSGTSGSGKTFSGLLLAAGLAGGKKVAMIDAENGRGSFYADDPDIRAALPNGYLRLDFQPPFSPARYIEAISVCEAAGVEVCLIDSTSHEWEGEGGCVDIAENKRIRNMDNWSAAKREHKKFMMHCMSSQMHILFCLRARDKVKVLNSGDIVPGTTKQAEKAMVVPLGIQPVAEKNLVFEMVLSLGFDESTHHAYGIKVPRMLAPFFPGGRLLTMEDGAQIRKWNESGQLGDMGERLKLRAFAEAEMGTEAYKAFFAALKPDQKKILAGAVHEEMKAIAAKADAAGQPQFQTFDSLESAFDSGVEFAEVAGKRYRLIDGNYKVFDEAA